MVAQHSPPDKSVAVLPFVDHSDEPGNEYFSQGISEEITNALSLHPGLRVAPRTSSFALKSAQLDRREVAARLKVAAVLEGSVQKVGDRVRIIARLYGAEGGSQIWSEQYECALPELFGVQKEITAAIARCLKVTLPVGLEKRYVRPTTDLPEAYDVYLKGRYVMENRAQRNLNKGLEYFEQAVAVDPDFAPAHTGIADILALQSLYGFERPHDVMPRARSAAERALALDDNLSGAHAALGFILMGYAWDWDGAEREYRRALELSPHYVTALAHSGFYIRLCIRNEDAEGFALIQRAIDADPLATMPVTILGSAAYYTDRGAEFVERIQEGVEGHPSLWLSHRALGFALLGMGRHGEAVRSLEKAVELSGRNHWTLIDLGVAKAVAGERDAALAVHEELVAESSRRYLQPFSLAAIPAALGQTEVALTALEKAFEERDGILVVIRRYPAFRTLHDEPRFKTILRGMGL